MRSGRKLNLGSVNLLALGLVSALVIVLAMPMVSKILAHEASQPPVTASQQK